MAHIKTSNHNPMWWECKRWKATKIYKVKEQTKIKCLFQTWQKLTLMLIFDRIQRVEAYLKSTTTACTSE